MQHHATKIMKIMKDTGLPQQQVNLAFGHFDDRAAQHFTNPNVRNLADMSEGGQPMRETRRAIQEAQRIATSDQESQSDDDEEDDDDDYDYAEEDDDDDDDEFDYDTSHATTTRATDSTKKRPIKGQETLLHRDHEQGRSRTSSTRASTISTQHHYLWTAQKVKTQELRLGYHDTLHPKAEPLRVWQL
eukprot:1633970-Amphidinium_carterae.2